MERVIRKNKIIIAMLVDISISVLSNILGTFLNSNPWAFFGTFIIFQILFSAQSTADLDSPFSIANRITC
jgi:hypothetical protein